jgi:hypothetical protein
MQASVENEICIQAVKPEIRSQIKSPDKDCVSHCAKLHATSKQFIQFSSHPPLTLCLHFIAGNATQASRIQRISLLQPRRSTYPASPSAQSCVSYRHSHLACWPRYTVSFAFPSRSPFVAPDLLVQLALWQGIRRAPYAYSQRSSAPSTHVSLSCNLPIACSATHPWAPIHLDQNLSPHLNRDYRE